MPRYVEVSIYRAMLETVAAEHAARMTAMEAASSNAGKVIDTLTLNMNRARQAAITKEIIEVVSGASRCRNKVAGKKSMATTATESYRKSGPGLRPRRRLRIPRRTDSRTPLRDPHHQRGLRRSRPIDIICETAAAPRRRPHPHHRVAGHRRTGPRHEGHQPGRARHGSRRQGDARPRAQRDRRTGGQAGPRER